MMNLRKIYKYRFSPYEYPVTDIGYNQKMEEKQNAAEEGNRYAWGSPELETATETKSDGSYFKPDLGEPTRIRINTEHDPVEKFVIFKEGEGPKRRFDIQVFTNRKKNEDGKIEWFDEKTWSIAPMYLNKINNYIERTGVFEVTKKEQGWDINPLGLPVE